MRALKRLVINYFRQGEAAIQALIVILMFPTKINGKDLRTRAQKILFLRACVRHMRENTKKKKV